MDRTHQSFERYSADRLLEDRDQITLDWLEQISPQLGLPPEQVFPHERMLDDIPVVLAKAAEFLVTEDTNSLTSEQIVTEEMRNIARLRLAQGWNVREIMREFDELARILDGAALRWVDDYPGEPDPKSVGRVFGRLNRVPLLMGEIMVGTVEAERTDLLRRLASVEEEERLRLSRELHDQTGQLVTGLLLGLRSLRSEAGDGEETARIAELEGLATRIARGLQETALELRPPALETLGLALALRSYVEAWSERHNLPVDFQCLGVEGERFSVEIETGLYRIVQEGLTNVVRHARATRVSVLLEQRRGSLNLIIEDDGIGFVVHEVLVSPEKAKRLGLRGMRERVALLGGSMAVESSPGSGTTLFVRIANPGPGTPVPDAAR